MTREELITEMCMALAEADAYRVRLLQVDHCCKAVVRCEGCVALPEEYEESPKRTPRGSHDPIVAVSPVPLGGWSLEDGHDYNLPHEVKERLAALEYMERCWEQVPADAQAEARNAVAKADIVDRLTEKPRVPLF